MKASELMAHLIKVIADHGDIEVEVFDRMFANYHQPLNVYISKDASETTAVIEV